MKNIIKHLKKNWYRYILETAVVVVGVLLAFSLTNWNESNRIKKLEKSTLLEISNALESDLVQLTDWIAIKQKQDSNVSTILDYLLDNGPHNEDLNKLWQSGFLRPIFVFNTSPYDLLKSRGFDIIKNDKIRKDIQQHYDISIPFMLDYLDRNYGLMNNFRNEYISLFRKGSAGFE